MFRCLAYILYSACFLSFRFFFLLFSLPCFLTCGYLVHITQSHTLESMSFTYQRSSTSLNIATKPSSSHTLLDSDSDSEEDSLPYLPISSEPISTGDILKIVLSLEFLQLLNFVFLQKIITLTNIHSP